MMNATQLGNPKNKLKEIASNVTPLKISIPPNRSIVI